MEATKLAAVIVSTVKAMEPYGAPSGVIYAALMGVTSYDHYCWIISILCSANILTQSNHLLRISQSNQS